MPLPDCRLYGTETLATCYSSTRVCGPRDFTNIDNITACQFIRHLSHCTLHSIVFQAHQTPFSLTLLLSKQFRLLQSPFLDTAILTPDSEIASHIFRTPPFATTMPIFEPDFFLVSPDHVSLHFPPP